MDDKNRLDDLIGSNQPIIIKESSDKKFLYTLLILLVVLFVVAIAIVAFLGSKYFNSKEEYIAKAESYNKNKLIQNNEANRKAIAVAKEEISKNNKSDTTTLKELEAIVKSQESNTKEKQKPTALTKEQKAIKTVASSVSKAKLSDEDLQKLAKLVASELKKSNTAKSNVNNSDKELVKSLESASTDTLKKEQLDTTNLKDAKVSKNGKKLDTYNKVIIKGENSNDEFSQISNEIDAILADEEVVKKEATLEYKKELKQEIATRTNELRFIVVKKGDTLSSLARKAYGRASAYDKIYKANPDLIKNPDKIYIGMKIRVPVDEEYMKQQGN